MCGVVFGIFAEYTTENGLVIYTSKYLNEYYNNKATENGYASISIDDDNYRTVAYDILLVNKNDRYGLTDLNFKEKVGIKYDTIKFNEQTREFIVSSGSKYGVINEKGEIKINLFYDEITIINYSPLLYKVKNNNKYGILNSEGKTVVTAKYDEIGYKPADEDLGEEPVTIIQNINEETKLGIVVKEDTGYGIIDAEDGEKIIESTLDKIYAILKNGQITYEAVFKGQTVDLLQYIKAVTTIVIPVE